MRTIRRNRRDRKRKGIEAVETALTLPLLAFVMFASSQIAHQIHVQTLLKIAGAEAAYAWGKKDGTRADAERVFYEHCEALGLNNCYYAIHGDSLDGDTNPDEVIGCVPLAYEPSNRLPLPLSVSIPSRYGQYWIACEDIFYRREAH